MWVGLLDLQKVVVDVIASRLLNPSTDGCGFCEVERCPSNRCKCTNANEILVQRSIGRTVDLEDMVIDSTLWGRENDSQVTFFKLVIIIKLSLLFLPD